VAGSDVGDGKSDDTFGLTAERKSSEPPVFNTKLGSYQRPMSAHGVRNQQDSTFSLTGNHFLHERSKITSAKLVYLDLECLFFIFSHSIISS
jgi:hypothetical protein